MLEEKEEAPYALADPGLANGGQGRAPPKHFSWEPPSHNFFYFEYQIVEY